MSKWSAAQFWQISIAHNLAYNKTKLCKTLGYLSRDMLNTGFLEKSLGVVSPPHFVYYFSRKMFLMLCSIILLADQIPFPDCLYFLR